MGVFPFSREVQRIDEINSLLNGWAELALKSSRNTKDALRGSLNSTRKRN